MTELNEGANFSFPPVPVTAEELPQFLAGLLPTLQEALVVLRAGGLEELNAEPVRKYTGLIVLADGTNWNPGSGQGVYCYYGGGWHFLG